MKRAHLVLLMTCLLFVPPLSASGQSFASHPPIRPLPKAGERPMGEGPARFVDAAKGDDGSDGSRQKPWRTINHAMLRLAPGETLYLRGGTYFENVYCAIAGTPEQPITIRSYPGELAVIDGGIPEFQTDPAGAWEPVPAADGGVEGEYRSTRSYKNIRDVVGLFGDSNVGLQTYWYTMDLRAQNETWIPNEETFIDPMYCGPGLWYDKLTGRIHARFAHTRLALPETVNHRIVQYQGETDPRKLPVVVAPFDSTPLRVDQAMHVRFQDLVIRGGGLITVKLSFGVDISIDRCTIYCGNYGIWSKGTGPLEMVNTGVYGMMAPWMFRTENCSYAYSAKVYPPFVGDVAQTEIAGSTQPQPRRVVRHISRLPTHAILVTEGGFEFETFYYPLNHDWNVHHCEFTDSHDGVYPSGRDIHFRHNLVDNIQDDAVYISSPTPYITDGLYIYQNLIRQCWMAFGGHARGGPGGRTYIYRNVVDMRKNVQFGRPTPRKPEGTIGPGADSLMVHNPDHIIHMEDICFYHNTALVPMSHSVSAYTSGMASHFHPDAQRRVFNNLYVFTSGAKRYPLAMGFKREKADLAVDGNLHWHANPEVPLPSDVNAYLKTSRQHTLSEANKTHYPDGWDSRSVIADPRFVSFQFGTTGGSDLRLKPDSPAIDAGTVIPEAWPDPMRASDAGAADIGALPAGADPLRIGIDGRHIAGE